MQIVLVGYMGSGKTTIGKMLAKNLNINFIDLDNYIEGKEKDSIGNIFSNKGEIYFRKIENTALKELLSSDDSFVLAVGGGTPCYANNAELISRVKTSIYLKTSIKELYKRLQSQKGHRPLIKDIEDDSLQEFIAKHLFERAPYYKKARIIISTDSKGAEEIINEITLSMQPPLL